MRKIIGTYILSGLLILVLSGCAAHHYKTEGDCVHIYIKQPNAEEVYFVSSIDQYKLNKAKRVNKTTWEVTVSSRECFKYFYIIDGALHTPACRFKEVDDFGSENCIYVPNL